MPEKKRIFVSSVQKELELERAAVAQLIATDPFLLQHCVAVLFEQEPPPPHPEPRPYLAALRGCAIYVLLLANEYGTPDGDLSATHHEYRLAQSLKLPTIVFLKGRERVDQTRCAEIKSLIAEIKQAGHTYKRFDDREDLKPEMLRALIRTLKEDFGLTASSAEMSEGEHLIEAASTFETAVLRDVPVGMLEEELLNAFNQQTSANDVERVFRTGEQALQAHGLAVRVDSSEVFFATAGALILFDERPADRFPQCEILVDAYDEARISGRPKGQIKVNGPLPRALEQVLEFIDKHTFHPSRVVGLNNVRLDEYPVAALREALVNAVAHRNYDDASRKILVQVFSDRIEIASPGYPPQPLTLAKLRRGGYRPCSRNPLIAQTLAAMGKMEQRGSGFARMQEAMLNHGLDGPKLDLQDGFFVVTLPGPAGDYSRLKVPAGASGPITPAIEAKLNARQKRIMQEVQKTGTITSGWCRRKFKVVRDTANRDLAGLVGLGLLELVGKGRGARYAPRKSTE